MLWVCCYKHRSLTSQFIYLGRKFLIRGHTDMYDQIDHMLKDK